MEKLMNAMQGCQEEEAIKEFLGDRVSNSHDPRTEEEKSWSKLPRPKISRDIMTEAQKKADSGLAMYTPSVAEGVQKAKDAAVKWTPTPEIPKGKFYDTSGHWYEDDPTAVNETRGVIDRAVHNSPPPLDDVGGIDYNDLDDKDPQRSLLDPVSRNRKQYPVCTGLLDYFPLAMKEIARVSKISGQKHHPGQEMHWERGKSTDHADCLVRHLMERGDKDKDGMRHTAKVAWRALALLQLEMEHVLEEEDRIFHQVVPSKE